MRPYSIVDVTTWQISTTEKKGGRKKAKRRKKDLKNKSNSEEPCRLT